MRRPSTRATAAWLLVGIAAIWGSSFTLVKDALTDCSPLLFNLLRMTLAAFLLLALQRDGWRELPRRAWIGGCLAGAFLAAGYQFQTAGLARTAPAKSALITGLIVVIAPMLMAIPWLRPKGARAPGPGVVCGALFGFAGLVLLTTPTGVPWSEWARSLALGDLLSLICAFAFAGHLIVLSRVSPEIPPQQLAALQISVCAVCMLVLLPLESGGFHLHFGLRLAVALLVTSTLATAAAFTVQSFAQRHLPATLVVLLLALEPVFGWLTALLVLGQRLERRMLAGAGLILLGVLLTELTESRRAGHPPLALPPDTPLPENLV